MATSVSVICRFRVCRTTIDGLLPSSSSGNFFRQSFSRKQPCELGAKHQELTRRLFFPENFRTTCLPAKRMPVEDVEPIDPVADEVTDEDDDAFEDAGVGVEKKLTDDGGLTKTILVPGTGWEKPEAGDSVEVHYVGTLEDGTKFDSSRDRDEPFTFNLGKGEVIKGWDEGVKSMRKGEKAILKCGSDYAYGDSGSPPKIPPKATLNFEVELLSWTSLKDISGDGGVIKTIINDTEEWDTPKERDEVLVKYTAKIQGADAPFTSTSDEGIEFTLEDGHLCKAIPVAIKTMKKTEKAAFIVKPEYGFGEGGNTKLGVPPNSTLEIELELVSWKKVEDVTDDGLVVRKVLNPGKGWDKPKEGATVTVRYTGRLQNGSVFEERGEGNEHQFQLDEEVVVDGLDLAITKMDKGETALITVHPKYGYKDTEHAAEKSTVPANSTLIYTLELVDMDNPKQSWDMTNTEKVADAKGKKEKGNVAYKAGKIERAVKKYESGLKMIEYDKEFAGDEKNESKDLKKSLWLNIAAAYLKLKTYKKVVEHCNKVLEVDPASVKALYRRSQAYLGTSDFIEAEQDIKNARDQDPTNKELLLFHRKLKQQSKASSQKEAKMYSTMFSKLAKLKDPDENTPHAMNGSSNSAQEGVDAEKVGNVSEESEAGPSGLTHD